MHRPLLGLGSWSQASLHVLRALNLDSFRLFVPAYLLVYGATLVTLPPGLLTQENPWRLAIGYGSVVVGLATMWLNATDLRPPARWVIYGFLAGVVLAGGVMHVASGSLLSASVAAGIGLGLLLIPAAGADDSGPAPAAGQRDYLIYVMALPAVAQGLAFFLDVGAAAGLQQVAGIPAVPYGAMMIASAAAVMILNTRATRPAVVEWAAVLICGGSLLTLQVIAAARIDPLYWWVGASVAMLSIGLMLSPLWRLQWAGTTWASLRTRVSAALVTTASVSILTAAAIGLSSQAGVAGPVMELLFAAVASCLLVVYVVGWWWGGRVARPQQVLAASVSTLQPGLAWRAPRMRRDAELALIAREIEVLADRLVDEKAAAAHRAAVSVNVERALSSSLEIETALTALLDALVPDFCDAAGAYVRRGDEIVRLAIQGPEDLVAVSTYPLRQEATLGPIAVIRRGEPEFYLDAPPADYFTRVGLEAEHGHEPLNVSSLMIAPIVGSDGATDGAISVKLLGGRRRFTDFDVASLLDFASRAALAVENGRLFEAVREASAAKDEFLGLVSHELRTPITTILGDAVLLRRDRSPEQRAELAADIEAESTRLAEIVENLLAIGRMGLTAEITIEPTRLEAALIVSIAEARRSAPHREFVLRSTGPIVVESNESYIQVVMHNLLTNSAKYSDRTKPIEVEVDTIDGRAVVSVLDRGPDLSALEAERMFDAFYRGPNGGRKGGLGIGLTVCRRIIEALGGRIDAKARPGGGVIVWFALPLSVTEEVGTRPDSTEPVAVGGEGLEPPTFSV